jgi:hypothetical protein
MQKPVLIIVLLFAKSFLHAQENRKMPVWAATFTGAILPLPAVNIGIQPGIYWRLNERFSGVTEITFRTGKRADKDSEAVDKKYLRIQQELRYHFKRKKNKGDWYTGLRLAYAQRQFADINSGFYATGNPGSDKGFYYDQARIKSPVFSSSLQLGIIIHGKKKIAADLFAGIGARFIRTTYSDAVNLAPGTRTRPSGSPVFYASYDFNGAAVWLHANAGVRLLYQISK